MISDGQKDEVGHEPDGVAGGPVFASFFVVFFVELADEFFEDGAHGVVIDAGGAEVDVGIEEFVDEGAEGVGFGEGGELVAEFEVFDDFLDVGEKPLR